MKLALTACSILFGISATGAFGAYLNNGEFSVPGSGTDFYSWAESGSDWAGPLQSGITGTSLLLNRSSTTSYLAQSITGSLHAYTLDMDLAVSAATANARTFNMLVRHSQGSDQINLRIVDTDGNGKGEVSVFNSATSSWVDIIVDAITFSTDTAHLQANHLRITIDYATGKYSIFVTAADNHTSQAVDIAYFQGSATIDSATTATRLLFTTDNTWTPNGWAVADNISITVPEAATMVPLACGAFALLKRQGNHS